MKSEKDSQEEKERLLEEQKLKMFSSMQRALVKDIQDHFKTRRTSLATFKAEDVARFLQNPVNFEKQIRNLSNYLYNVSPQYRRIIQYFALLPTYDYTLEPYSIPEKIDKERYKKAYFRNLKDIEKMNLKHELIKVMKIAFREDVFYGYVLENKESFFIMNLDANYCKITSIEDGVYNFSFDFSFFDSNQKALDSYPEEFQKKYDLYKRKIKDKFIELDSDSTICIKVNEELLYPLPPFNIIFESIFELDDYKKIKKQKTKMDNFLLLTQKIPQAKDSSMDQFTINLDLAGTFHELLSEAVPDGVSVALSPMDITPVRVEKSKNDADTIQQSVRDLYVDSGVPQQIFNSGNNTSTGLAKSIITDEQIAFGVLRQIERWVNRRLSKNTGAYKFHLKFLDMTVFNRKDVQDALLKAAQSSMPVINEYAASLGMSPMDLYNKAILENDVLGLHDMLRPLMSSHTQSSKDSEGGRDKVADDEASDSTIINRDANTDEDWKNE